VLVLLEPVEHERRRGVGHEHRAVPARVGHHEGLPAAPPLELVFLAATDLLISVRVDREQHVHPPVGVGVQHDEVTILGGLGVDLGSIAVFIVAVRTEPQTHRGIPGRAVSGGRRDSWALGHK